jgi:hypothetical protein
MRAIELPRVETYPLLAWDPAGETTVTLREARAGETALRDGMLAIKYIERELPDGTLEREYRQTALSEIAYVEAWAAFGSSNLVYNGIQMFRADMDAEQFATAWGLLPDELTLEWHALVKQHNPNWSVA